MTETLEESAREGRDLRRLTSGLLLMIIGFLAVALGLNYLTLGGYIYPFLIVFGTVLLVVGAILLYRES